MKINYTLILLLFLFIFSCNKKHEDKINNNDNIIIDTQQVNSKIDTVEKTNVDTQTVQVSEIKIKKIKRCEILEKYKIPQPDEILIQDSTLTPDFNLLYNVNMVYLNTVFSQSVILGLVSSDLIYSTIFKNKNFILKYFTISAKLADKLGVGRILNQKDIENIDKQTDFDSIKNIVFSKTRQVCIELSNQNSHIELSYIIYGALIENNFLLVNTLLKNPSASDSLYQKLADQNEIIDNVINYYNFVLSVVDNYDISLNLNAMINDLTEVKKVYDKIYNGESILVNEEELKELDTLLRKYKSNLLVKSDKKIEMQVKKNKISIKNKQK